VARYSKAETERKKQQAKEMYIKQFDIPTIAEIINISPATVQRWAKEDDFEAARKSKIISLSELRAAILDSFNECLQGNKPKIKPDEAAKYAAAFEKLSDKKKVLSYMYESFEMLTDNLTESVQNASSKKEKELALDILKIVRTKTDEILTRLTSEVLNEN
jgi:uncharacterized protein YjcR